MNREGDDQEPNPNPDDKSDKGMTPENRRRVGEAVVLILYFVVDAYELWPVSHSLALTAAVAGASAIFFMELPPKSWAVTTVVLAGLAGIIYLVVGPLVIPTVEMTGSLRPGADLRPSVSCPGMTIGLSDAIVLVGSNVFVQPVAGHTVLLGVNGMPVVAADRTPDGISIDASIFDSDGGAVAVIKGNAFQALTGENVRMTRPDLSTISVTDGRNTELLYVRYMNPTTILIRAKFTFPGTSPVVIDDKAVTGPGKRAVAESCFVNGANIGFSQSTMSLGSWPPPA